MERSKFPHFSVDPLALAAAGKWDNLLAISPSRGRREDAYLFGTKSRKISDDF